MLMTYTAEISSSPIGDVGLFILFSKYEERDIPKAAGFRWDASTKRWFTSSREKARRLIAHADAAARAVLEIADAGAAGAGAAGAIAASRATDADIEIPAPPGLAYMPFQRAGIAYAIARPATLIGDEMGLGKTIQAIGLANVISSRGELHRTLIICPASLRLNWQCEWKRWHTGRLRPVIVTDLWPLALRGVDLLAEPVAAIMSYEGAIKWQAECARQEWDLLILDEVHYLKNRRAKRTHAVFGFQRPNHPQHTPPIRAKRRVGLSGTPIVNRPEELWPIVRSFDRDGLGADALEYRRRYVDAPPWPEPPQGVRGPERVVWQMREHAARKAAALKELHDRLRGSIMVRRLKSEVLQDLPAKRRQIVLLDVANAGAILARERQALAEASTQLQRKRAEVDAAQAAGDEAGHREAVRRLAVWRGAAMTEISRIRHETAVAKLPAVIEHLFAALDETEKVVIFGHHHDVVDGVVAALPEAAVKLDGRMTDAEKAAAVARFQGDRGCRVFVGSIRAAGLGITLTAASVVLFAELDWTPSGMVQAEDRCHRIGQKDAVFVQHLVLDGSIDQKMSALLVEKATIIDAIMDGKAPPEAQQSILDEVLNQATPGRIPAR